MENPDITAEPYNWHKAKDWIMKQFKKKEILLTAAAFFAMCLYFTSSWMIDLKYAEKEKAEYSNRMVSSAMAAGGITSARIKTLSGSLEILKKVYLAEYAEEKRGLGSVIDLFEIQINSFPELVSISYMNASSELVYARGVDGDEGEVAVNASIDWAREYWPRLGPDDEKPFYTPVKKADRYYIQGMLYAVSIENKIAGGLTAVIDAETLAEKSFELAMLPDGANIFMLDSTGAVIARYPAENAQGTDYAGVFNGAFLKQALLKQNGFVEMKSAASAKGKKAASVRSLAAWQQIRLGTKDAVIVIVSPAQESVRIFKNARFTHMLLEFLFAVIVAISAGLAIWAHRRKDLLSGEQESKD
jgi:hypothetical protein